jgi:hypothetical protein
VPSRWHGSDQGREIADYGGAVVALPVRVSAHRLSDSAYAGRATFIGHESASGQGADEVDPRAPSVVRAWDKLDACAY